MANPKVLVLGDYTNYQYHPFSGIVQVLAELLANEGLELKFTEDRQELENANLSRYNALITYVDSWDQTLPPEQMRGMIGFTAAGKRIFGIHCGISYANQEYYQLFGARFTGHPPLQEIAVKIKEQGHPLTKGLDDFKVEDELYQFKFADFPQLKVLLEGELGGASYPLAWEKPAGAGALLYLALGHDRRAFENVMFRKTLLNGALWAISK